MTAQWETRWRGKPIAFAENEGIPRLVRLARLARQVTVDFRWELTETELRLLRQAVCLWGANTVGRYKKFDAEVLSAINELLGEPDSAYRHELPRGAANAASCAQAEFENGSLVLRGYASFDVILGYTAAGCDPRYSAGLGTELSGKLTQAAQSLGWDARLLTELRYAAVKNALYGLPLAYGGESAPPEPGPIERELHVAFTGPLSVFAAGEGLCFLDAGAARSSGIYLVTIASEGKEYVHYVGQTRRSFAERIGEHAKAYAAGEYTILNPAELAKGKQSVLWQGSQRGGEYCRRLPDYLDQLSDLAPRIRSLLGMFRYHLAPIAKEHHGLLDQLEGGLGRHFQLHEDQRIQELFGVGARHPISIPGASRIRCHVSSETEVVGLPSELVV